MKKIKAGIAFNLKRPIGKCGDKPPDFYAEYDTPSTISSIKTALQSFPAEVIPIEASAGFFKHIKSLKPNIVFNIAEGLGGDGREAQVPAILDMLGIPYTGSGVATLVNCLKKSLTKIILLHHKIPTPAFAEISNGNRECLNGLKFPLIVKPVQEGSSKGITADSVVHNHHELKCEIEKIINFYKQPALIEEFIEGREFTVGIMGNGKLETFPIMELDFSECQESFYTYKNKSKHWKKVRYLCPAPIDRKKEKRLKTLALAAFKALGCNDFARVDIRFNNKTNEAFVIDINPIPGFTPNYSDFPMMAEKAGYTYEKLIHTIFTLALKRHGIKCGGAEVKEKPQIHGEI